MDKPEKPLAGKRIVITRAPEQAGDLTLQLQRAGAEVISMPAVAFAPPEDWHALDEALRRLDAFSAIIFLSQNAVRYVCQRCRALGLDCRTLGAENRFIAAVGPATAAAAAREGLHVDYVAKNHTGESLVRELLDPLSNRNVLLPRSDHGDDRVAAALRAAGAHVSDVIAYRTTAPESFDAEILGLIRRGEIDAIIFASPSAFRNLADAIGGAEIEPLSRRTQFTAIGPTTARAIRESGALVAIESAEATPSGLTEAMTLYYAKQPSAAPARRT